MSDLISRQTMIDKMRWHRALFCKNRLEFMVLPKDEKARVDEIDNCIADLVNAPSVEPNNQVHLCNSCKYDYPECPAEMSDIIFGNGKGHDNVCACAKFEIKPERTTRVECIAEVYKDEIVDHYLSGICGICGESTYDRAKYCSECGTKLDWSE